VELVGKSEAAECDLCMARFFHMQHTIDNSIEGPTVGGADGGMFRSSGGIACVVLNNAAAEKVFKAFQLQSD